MNSTFDVQPHDVKILQFIASLVIKNAKRADDEETTNSHQNAQMYFLALDMRDSFASYMRFWTPQHFIEAGADPERFAEYFDNPESIDDRLKERLVEIERQYRIENYVELNDYYRELNGEPGVEERPIMTSLGKFAHVLNASEINELEKNGELDKIREANPTKRYLYHISHNKVSPARARRAAPFAILSYDENILEDEVVRQFMEIYYSCVAYITNVAYSDAFKMYEHYESAMIMIIVTMALQKFLNRSYIQVINRNFSDMAQIKDMFHSYGLPFFPDVPLRYQQRIIKNLNKLIANKGTDRALIEIVDQFDLDDVTLMRYILVKDAIVDSDGKPILNFDNLDANYDMKFIKVPIEDRNIPAQMSVREKLSYESVIEEDSFWGPDFDENDPIAKQRSDFKNEILAKDFNYLSTKFMSITTMQNISKSFFDVCYLFNMFNTLHHNNQLDLLTFNNTSVKGSGHPIRLIDAIVAINILLFKKHGYDDIIVNTPTAIGSIYAFNFNQDIDVLINKINSDASVDVDGRVLRYNINKLSPMDLHGPQLSDGPLTRSEVIDTFITSNDARKNIQDRIYHAESYLEYKTLNELFRFHYLSESIQDLFRSRHGFVFNKYSDFLEENDPELFGFINYNSSDKEVINKTINDIIYSIEMFLNDHRLEGIFSSFTMTGVDFREYLMMYLNLFKAYTVQFTEILSDLSINDRNTNTVKLTHSMKLKMSQSKADSFYLFRDTNHTIVRSINMTEKMNIQERLRGI